MIGKGDSSKSTILEAIRYAFHPQWSLTLSDSDFHQCKVADSIVIEVTIGALTEALCSLDKYGQYLRGWDAKQGDRNKVSVGLIGAYSEKQLTGTALAKLTEAQSLNELLANASRTARASLDGDRPVTLKNFDAAAGKSQEIAKLLGGPVSDAYKAHLDLASINLKVGGLALHDGDMRLGEFFQLGCKAVG